MKKNYLNYKLVNVALFSLIISLIYFTLPLWIGILNKFLAVFMPFLVAFAIAYALYPFLQKLQNRGIPKPVSIMIILTVLLAGVAAIFYALFPILYDQIISLTNLSINAIKDLSNEYNINLSFIQEKLTDIGSLTKQFNDISSFGINVVTSLMSIIALTVIVMFVSLYFLNEMESIRTWIKKVLSRSKNTKKYKYVEELDHQMTNYFEALQIFMIIQFFEYTIAFMIIGHPYFLLMGILASVTTVIPYFGGIASNIVAIITAALVSPKLIILSIIATIVLPMIDGYLLSPRIYSKSNNIHPLIIIFSVFAGGIIIGIWGIIISLPLAILVVYTYRFYEEEIKEKIKESTN